MKKQEEKKEVSFISVINVITGIIIAIFGVLILIIAIFLLVPLLFILSIIFFVFAVFLFLPQKILRINKWLKLLIATVGFFVAIILLGGNIPKTQTNFEEHNLNEPFTITYNKMNFSMIIYNSSQEYKLIVDGKEKTTSGVFILVNGIVINEGNYASELSFSSGLMDSQNKSYSLHSANLESGEIQPGLSRNFFLVFEVPKSASGLKVLVADQTRIVRRITLER